ncbi:DUF7284 family protein [Halopiger goleimassiliensis]|uniref:DUF7284 family protein n=1 Tax=Halopiger goleimassiliensis TaxID=1293048 RepID=UPI000677A6B3|nr:hypothetical protein [Halopiger goleimassiliensis]
MVGRDRAISTVVDVCLALLIVSATVTLIGVYLHDGDRSIEGDRGDQALETLSGSTVTITYDLNASNESGHAATEIDNYDLPENLEPENVSELYNVTTYGAATDLLGEAARSNLQIEGAGLFAYGDEVERSVEAAIGDRLVGSEGHVYAVATWEPYDGAGINGTATAGTRPPSTADVSSATTTISSNVPAPDPDALVDDFDQNSFEGGVEDGFDLIAEHVADAILEGYFPPERTQYTLESSLTENAVTLYNYRQVADAVGVDVEDEITGTKPNAADANDLLSGSPGDDGLTAVVADDLRNSSAGEQIQSTYESFGEELDPAEADALAETISECIEPETIDITVQTWG